MISKNSGLIMLFICACIINYVAYFKHIYRIGIWLTKLEMNFFMRHTSQKILDPAGWQSWNGCYLYGDW